MLLGAGSAEYPYKSARKQRRRGHPSLSTAPSPQAHNLRTYIMSTLAINRTARPPVPELSPNARKQQCVKRELPPNTLRTTSPPSVAVCFFGMLARYKKIKPTSCRQYDAKSSECAEDVWLTRELAQPSFVARVVRANPQMAFDVFLHTWSVAAEPIVRRYFRPRAAAFGPAALGGRSVSPADMLFGWPRDTSPGMWASIEIVLDLKRQIERQRGAAYTWVLLTRPDLMWLSDFRFASLNPELLYMANVCVEAREAPEPPVTRSPPPPPQPPPPPRAQHHPGATTRALRSDWHLPLPWRSRSPPPSSLSPLPPPPLRAPPPPPPPLPCTAPPHPSDYSRVGGCQPRALRPSKTYAPDWYFAGASALIDLVFHNLTWDIERYCFAASFAMSSNHKVCCLIGAACRQCSSSSNQHAISIQSAFNQHASHRGCLSPSVC